METKVNLENYYTVGWVQAAQGIKGECFVRFYTQAPEWLDHMSELLVTKVTRPCIDRLKKVNSDKMISSEEVLEMQLHSFSKIKPHKNGYIVKFKTVSDRNAAELLKGAMLLVHTEALESSKQEGEYFLKEVIGFEVIDQANNLSCGRVKSFYNNGAHEILVLDNEFTGKEVPFVDHFIVKVDIAQKVIHMNLPEGLLDL